MPWQWCSPGLATRHPRDVSWLALDLETSGLDPCRHTILEYAAFSISPDGEIGTISAWRADADGEERFVEGLEAAANRLRAGAVLVAHNITFDLGFLAVRPDVPDAVVRPSAWMCTLRMLAGQQSLDRLAAGLGVSIQGRHTAVGDARGLGDALAAMLHLAASRKTASIGAMVADLLVGGGRPEDRLPPDRAVEGWHGVRAELDHAVPIASVTAAQRIAFGAATRLLEDRGRGPSHPIEHEVFVAALRGADIQGSALDLLVEEME